MKNWKFQVRKKKYFKFIIVISLDNKKIKRRLHRFYLLLIKLIKTKLFIYIKIINN